MPPTQKDTFNSRKSIEGQGPRKKGDIVDIFSDSKENFINDHTPEEESIKDRLNTKNDIDIIPTGNPGLGIEYSEILHKKIREVFFVDQLQLHTGPQMTATEVMQRTEEKLRLMGPLLGRIQTELLGPLINRVYGLLEK